MKTLGGISYYLGVNVLKFDGKSRLVQIGLLFDEDHLLLQGVINPCKLSYSNEAIIQLNRLLLGKIGEYECGGGERAWFISSQTETTVMDNFEWEPNYQVPTASLRDQLQVRNDAMNGSKEGYIDLVTSVFEKIKHNQKENTNIPAYAFYEKINESRNLKVVMVLEAMDFELEKEAFKAQLRFNEWMYG